jgi:hypothetical protein
MRAPRAATTFAVLATSGSRALPTLCGRWERAGESDHRLSAAAVHRATPSERRFSQASVSLAKCCAACPLHLGATPRAGFQVASPSSGPLRNILSSKHRPACASRGRDPPHVVRHQNVLFVVLLPPLRVSLDCGSTRVWCREHHSRCRREGAAPLAKSKVSRQRVGAGRPTH